MNAREKIFTFLKHYRDEHGYPPSIREIAQGTGIVTSVVSYHLNRLEKEGRIRRAPFKSRAIQIVTQA